MPQLFINPLTLNNCPSKIVDFTSNFSSTHLNNNHMCRHRNSLVSVDCYSYFLSSLPGQTNLQHVRKSVYYFLTYVILPIAFSFHVSFFQFKSFWYDLKFNLTYSTSNPFLFTTHSVMRYTLYCVQLKNQYSRRNNGVLPLPPSTSRVNAGISLS